MEIDAFEGGTQQNLVGFLINYKKTNIFSHLNPSNLFYLYLYSLWILTYSALAIGVEIDAFEVGTQQNLVGFLINYKKRIFLAI